MLRSRSFQSCSASGDFNVYAVDARTGALIWKHPPTVINGILYMAPSYESSSYLYALDALTGTVLWKANPDPAFEPTDMAIANGTVYLVGAEFVPCPLLAITARPAHNLGTLLFLMSRPMT